jgi:putative membrane protein
MKTNDLLAIERTQLANERTFLAYFRTFIVFLSSGFAIIKLDLLKDISLVGYALIILAPILLFMGIFRYFRTRKRLKKYYN